MSNHYGRRNSAVVAARMPAQQVAQIKTLARKHRTTVGALVRKCLTSIASGDPEKAIAELEAILGLEPGAPRSAVVKAIDSLYLVVGEPPEAPSEPVDDAADIALSRLTPRQRELVLANGCDVVAFARGLQVIEDQRAAEQRSRVETLARANARRK